MVKLQVVKTCSKCHAELPLSEFSKRSRGGHASECRACRAVYDRAYHAIPEVKARTVAAVAAYRRAHREQHRAYNNAWNAANPEKVKASRAVHREQKAAYNKTYYAAHPEKQAAWSAAYYAAHPDKQRGGNRETQAARLAAHPLLRTWSGMKQRCANPNRRNYQNYGGRGITVCDRWLGEDGFSNFEADMGDRPSSQHSIDRIDVDGNYEPSNCRWATSKEQKVNQRPKMFVAEAIAIINELSGSEIAARFAAIRRYNALPVATPAMIAQAKSGEATWSWERPEA